MTLYRAIKTAKSVFGVEIEYVRQQHSKNTSLPAGNSGYYRVTDWGFVNRNKLAKHVDSLIENGLLD